MDSTIKVTLEDERFSYAKPLFPMIEGTLDMGVYITTHGGWQDGHRHTFCTPTKEGDAYCEGCGAGAWAPLWVKPGVHDGGTDHGTTEWLAMMVHQFDDLVDSTAQHLVERELGAVCIDGPGVIPQVVLAALDPSEPARRPGLSVPTMERGKLS